MTSATVSQDKPAYDVLARKTVEILDVVSSARLLLIEQYNNDQTMWLEAMFRVLMWKNPTFIEDERISSIKEPNVHKFLRDLIFEMFRSIDEQNEPTSDSTRRNQLLETGCNLISTFRVFTNFLVHCKLDVSNEMANLQSIAKNINKYVQNCDDKPDEAKLANHEEVKSNVRKPEEAKSLENESQTLEPVANEPPKLKPASNEPEELESAGESQEVEPDESENIESESLSQFPLKKKKLKKQATSTRDVNEETFGFEATALALKDSVVSGEMRSTTPAELGANDHLCEICNDPITVFNYDKDFSVMLHERKKKHQKAVNKLRLAEREGTRVEPEEQSSLMVDEEAIRKTIVDLVGEAQASLFEIDDGDEFFCTACKCSVYSTHNVVTHVQGRNHRKMCGLNSQESKESKSESDSRELTSDEVDSADDEDVLRVGSAIPVKSLFDSLQL